MVWLLLSLLLLPSTLAKPPHILYVVMDDMGWSDIGFTQGSEKTVTSAFIDGLAKKGLILNRHYSAWMCTPTRASIMTGRYPISLGIQHNVFNAWTEDCLSENLVLLPSIVKSNGYATHMVGKWHLGYARWSCLPCRRGFDTWLGYVSGYIMYMEHDIDGFTDFLKCENSKKSGFSYKVLDELSGIYSGDVYAKQAQTIIEEHNPEQPLFLYLALQTTHKPFFAPKRYMPHNCHGDRCVMQGMVNAASDLLQRVIAKLHLKGMWNDTIMVFHSDNGGELDKTLHYSTNYPLKGWKKELWEGGVRTAAFVYSPNHVLMPNRGVSDSYIHVSDWFSTIVSISGGWTKWVKGGNIKPNDLDGIDQSAHLLRGAVGPRTQIMLHIDPVKRVAGYFKGPYKLLIGQQTSGTSCSSTMFYPMDKRCLNLDIIQLFHIFDDPSETTNIADLHPEIVEELQRDIFEYLDHQKPLQCQLPSVTGAFPTSAVPYFLPFDFSMKLKTGKRVG